MPRVLGRALGPETCDHLVAGQAPVARAGQESEQGQAAPLGDHMMASRVGESQAAERLELEHEERMSGV